MRYKIEDASGILIPVSNSDSAMIVAVTLGSVIGLICIYLGWKGSQLWLKVWGVGLVLTSLVYFL